MRRLDHISRAVSGAAGLGGWVANRAGDAASRSALASLDVVLRSRFSEQVLDRLLASALAERAVKQALAGPLVEAAAADIERLADRAIDSTAAERVVARAIDGQVFDEAVARLLESEELWMLVDEIARSPAVTEAIGSQGMSFADQVAEAVRARSLNADERLETVVRGLVKRRKKVQPETAP